MNSIYILDTDNKINFQDIIGLDINIKGDNNTLFFGKNFLNKPRTTRKIYIKINGDNNIISINNTDQPLALNILINSDSQIKIGRNLLAWSLKLAVFRFNVTIGDNNLFAENITIMPEDGHHIYDKNTNKLLNKGSDIYIGNHNWFGRNVSLLKGSGVQNDCVVGFGTILTKKIPESNCVICGVPGRVVKRDIYWSNQYIPE